MGVLRSGRYGIPISCGVVSLTKAVSHNHVNARQRSADPNNVHLFFTLTDTVETFRRQVPSQSLTANDNSDLYRVTRCNPCLEIT